MDGLQSSSYFQVLQSLYQFFSDYTNCTSYNWYHHHFHIPQFFWFPSKVKVLIHLFTFFQLYFVVSQDSKVHNSTSSLFLLIIIRSNHMTKIRWSVCIPEEFVHLILQDRFWVVHIPFACMVKFKLLAQLPVDHLAHPVISFCANLLHLLIMWLIVSSLSPHNLHFLFCYILSIFALIWLVLMALFCAAIRRDSVSLLRFPFISYVHIFSCEMLLVSHLKCP